MNNIECETCIKRKTIYCPNSGECYDTENKPFYQNRIMLLKENKELHNKIDKAMEYIKKYQQIYDIDGSIEKQIDEFNILASPKRLLEILKDSDVDGR